MKKIPVIDQKTGEYNLRYNMESVSEDYYLPVRGGDSGTQIETLLFPTIRPTKNLKRYKIPQFL